jgi:hypothetical protein
VLVAIGCGLVLCCLAVMAVLAATGLWVIPIRSDRSTVIPIEATIEVEALATRETGGEEVGLPVAPAPTLETKAPEEIPVETEAPTDLPIQTEAPSAAPTTGSEPAETLAPLAATEETGPLETGGEFMEFRGIQFTYSPTLASELLAELVPGEGGQDLPYWRTYPDYWQFTFRGYPQGANDQAPRIMVFPVEAYARLVPDVQDIAGRLQVLLKDRPSNPDPETLPYLPFVNAHAFIHAKIHYLDFENGAGISYLTQFAQDVSPVTNSGLLYTFQGLTRTGQYYISAVLPVSHPDLLAEYEIPGGDIEAFIQGYDQYLQETRQQLDAYLPGGFTPHLELLDFMLQSLLVKPKKN